MSSAIQALEALLQHHEGVSKEAFSNFEKLFESTEDFLHEFLLVDEDEFQDEHRIYEPLIEYTELEEAEMESIRSIETNILPSSEIKDLFVPIVLFFQNADNTSIQQSIYTSLQPIERSLLACLLSYKQV